MSISPVQSNKAGSDTGVTSLNVTLGVGVTQGNILIASVKGGTNGLTFTYPDGSWQTGILNSGNSSNTKTIAIAYLIVDVSHAGQTSWTFQQDSSHSMVVTIAEYSSSTGWPASPVDQTAISNPTTQDTVITTGTTATTTQAEELWTGILTYSSISQTETNLTPGWTNRQEWTESAGTADVMYVDQVASSVGTAQCSFTIVSQVNNAGAVATFKNNGGSVVGSASVGSSGGGITPTASLQIPGSASVGSSGGGITPTGALQPILSTNPSTLTFSGNAGGGNPASQNDTLSETAGTSTAWTSSISYHSGSGWLGISPSSGTLSASGSQVVAYTCTTGALTAATYTATVTYTATTGGATATVDVTFTVNAAPPPGTGQVWKKQQTYSFGRVG